MTNHVESMQPSRHPIARYTRWLIRFRYPVLLLTVALALSVGSQARHLGLATNYRVFFGPDNPELQAFEGLEERFTKNDSVLFVVHTARESVFAPNHLQALSELTRDAWQIPFATRVDSITNFQHTRARGDDVIIEDLWPSDPPPEHAAAAAAAARAREVALTEPALAGRLIARNGRTTGVNVRLQLPMTSADEVPKAAAAARALADRFKAAYPDLRVELTGFAMLNDAFAEAPIRDGMYTMPIMLMIFLAVLVWVLRSLWAAGVTFGLINLATAVGLGWAGFQGLSLDPASAAAPVIILTIAVADAIHVFKSYFEHRRLGEDSHTALTSSLQVNAQPVFLTSLTTIVGFLSLNFSDSPPFHVLGNVAAVGVAAAWALTMTFLPAAMAIVPLSVPKRADRASLLAQHVGGWVRRHAGRTLALTAGLTALLLAAIGMLQINDKPVEYFSHRMSIRGASDFAMNKLGGIYVNSIAIDSGASQGITNPNYLARVDAFANWVREQPGVTHVDTFTDTMKRLNRSMHGDDPRYYKLPESQALASQYLLLYEMSVPYGLDTGDQIDIDKRALRVNVTYGDVDMKNAVNGEADMRTWLSTHGSPAMAASTISGPFLMFARITDRNIASMVRGTAFGFGMIALILVFALRNVKLGLLSLIPNILPAATAFGIWALWHGEVGFAVSIVAGLSIGIIVDDSVHFLSKYQHGRRVLGYSSPDAVSYAFKIVGGALVGTSLVVALGFAALSLSNFRVTAYMGSLTAITVLCALATDLLLLPALLIWIDRDRVPTTTPALAPLPPVSSRPPSDLQTAGTGQLDAGTRSSARFEPQSPPM